MQKYSKTGRLAQKAQINISIIDSSLHVILSNPYKQYTNRMIQEGFQSCVHQFGGKFISLASFIRNYGMYGHSFKSEFNTILPHDGDLDRNKRNYQCGKVPFERNKFNDIGLISLHRSNKGYSSTYDTPSISCRLHAIDHFDVYF